MGSVLANLTQMAVKLFGRKLSQLSLKRNGNSQFYDCEISLDGSPGFKTPASGVYTAIQVFSTSCSAEYADPAACAAD